MGRLRRWVIRVGLGSIFVLLIGGQTFGEEDAGVQEIIDVLQSAIQNLKDGQYGAASADLDYGNQRFKEQKGIWLAGCIVKEFQGWVTKGEPSIETVGAVAFGGGTTIEQTFDQKGFLAKVQITVSPVAQGLGAIFNPALIGGGKGRARRFPDGVTAQVEKGKITATVGSAILTWEAGKNKKKKVSEGVLWNFAKDSVDRECVKTLS